MLPRLQKCPKVVKYKNKMDVDLKKYIIKYMIENQWKHPHSSSLNIQNSHPYLYPYKNIHPLYFSEVPSRGKI